MDNRKLTQYEVQMRVNDMKLLSTERSNEAVLQLYQMQEAQEEIREDWDPQHVHIWVRAHVHVF